jgi:hypothetical protein
MKIKLKWYFACGILESGQFPETEQLLRMQVNFRVVLKQLVDIQFIKTCLEFVGAECCSLLGSTEFPIKHVTVTLLQEVYRVMLYLSSHK